MKNVPQTLLCLLLVMALAMPLASCSNKAQSGAGVGALSGALLGSLVSGDKLIGAGIGAGIGLALGYIIGNEWDKYDSRQLHDTLEYNRTGESSSWTNPDTGARYQATPQPAYATPSRDPYEVCRDVQIEAWIDGKKEFTTATACRMPNGDWRLQ